MFTWRLVDASTRRILEGGTTLRWAYLYRVMPQKRRLEKELEMAGDKKKMQFGPFFSLHWR